MIRGAAVGFAVLLAACSSSSAAPAPTSCAKTDRTGVYRLTFAEEAGGTCGAIPSSLVDFNAPGTGNCVTNSGVWSNGDCKYAADVTCRLSTGASLHEVEVTSETAADAAGLSGTLSVQISGPGACISTYDLTATRQ